MKRSIDGDVDNVRRISIDGDGNTAINHHIIIGNRNSTAPRSGVFQFPDTDAVRTVACAVKVITNAVIRRRILFMLRWIRYDMQ